MIYPTGKRIRPGPECVLEIESRRPVPVCRGLWQSRSLFCRRRSLSPPPLTWHVIAILRAVGWYVVLPLLVYAPVAVRHYVRPEESDAFGAGWRVFSWVWIVLCSIRAGGDQWDNPRYRLIFFGIEAAVAAFAWLAWRGHRGLLAAPHLGRGNLVPVGLWPVVSGAVSI